MCDSYPRHSEYKLIQACMCGGSERASFGCSDNVKYRPAGGRPYPETGKHRGLLSWSLLPRTSKNADSALRYPQVHYPYSSLIPSCCWGDSSNDRLAHLGPNATRNFALKREQVFFFLDFYYCCRSKKYYLSFRESARYFK